MRNDERKILLTFDVEEFDLPLDHGINLPPDEQMAVAKQGLDSLNDILTDKTMPCTLFTTANFARTFPGEISSISADHEIASHTFYHSSF
ncbi:MAG: polysaccharide deacetylase family protein, partial [Bacteroidota bacterium]|nr:polysaccharide deacetylase family protein [Bacteroidota bacterium]